VADCPVVRKYINLRLNSEAYRVIRQARATAARIDQERRTRNATKLAGIMALHTVRRAFYLDERVNFRFLPPERQAQLRKWRKLVEADLRRIAGDQA
jgi:hypothetical protein